MCTGLFFRQSGKDETSDSGERRGRPVYEHMGCRTVVELTVWEKPTRDRRS